MSDQLQQNVIKTLDKKHLNPLLLHTVIAIVLIMYSILSISSYAPLITASLMIMLGLHLRLVTNRINKQIMQSLSEYQLFKMQTYIQNR